MAENNENNEFTIEQKITVVAWAIIYNNCEKSVRLFAEKFRINPPSVRTVRFWKEKLLETGNLVKDRPRIGRPKSASTGEIKENILRNVNDNPSTSTRKVSNEVGVSHLSVQRVLKEEHYHGYKPIYCQKLHEDDFDRREQFCQIMLENLNQDPAFLRKIKFSDECVFGLESLINQHNIHFYAQQNPEVRLQHTGKTPTLTMWACLGYGGVVSYDISRDTMTGDRYCQILNEKVVPCFTRNRQWWYQHDGASSHFYDNARAILDESLNERWIGRHGIVEWPSRSPDLTAADYWFWSYLRDKVYNPPGYKFPNLNALGRKIEEEIQNIPLEMFRRTMNDFPKRLQQCLDAGGGHFEK